MRWTLDHIKDLKKAGKIKHYSATIAKTINPWGRKRRSIGGKREDLNFLFVRSQWEANYARYLNWLIDKGQIEKWEYEVDTFEFEGIKRGTRFYTPDFKVWGLDGRFEYHEVKGWMDKPSQVKIKRFMNRYRQFVLRIIDERWFKENTDRLKGLIPFWEG